MWENSIASTTNLSTVLGGSWRSVRGHIALTSSSDKKTVVICCSGGPYLEKLWRRSRVGPKGRTRAHDWKVGNLEGYELGVRIEKSGPLERTQLAKQIQEVRIPKRWDAGEKRKEEIKTAYLVHGLLLFPPGSPWTTQFWTSFPGHNCKIWTSTPSRIWQNSTEIKRIKRTSTSCFFVVFKWHTYFSLSEVQLAATRT